MKRGSFVEKNILIADDNEGIIDILCAYFVKEGYNPIKAYDGEEALQKFKQYNPIIVLLDIMMPKKDGLQVCKEIREQSNVPIIMITAKGEDADKIMGLDTGADDYVVKPFSPGEILARVRAILRRLSVTEEQKKNAIHIESLKINLNEYEVMVEGKVLNLTKKEVEIIWLLASNPNKVFTRDNLLDSIWGLDYFGDFRTVDTHIKRIRAKMNLSEQYNWDIKTIWGVGYKFEVKND
jgi:DNA-binding response OmpR family regulator